MIEWRDQYFPGSGTANFEVEFNEADEVIRAIYGDLTNGNASSTEGVQSIPDASIFDQYGCNGADGTLSNGLQVTYTPGGGPPPAPPPPPPPPPPHRHRLRRLRPAIPTS